MKQIKVSTPGKVHLMGEHAVVYGAPALLAAVNRRLIVIIEEAEQQKIDVNDVDAQNFIQHAIGIVDKEYDLQPMGYHLSIVSDLPFGYHLGSSAALAVATVGAYIYLRKKLWNPIEINRLAYEVEKKQHGNPSGGDNTSVTFGGFVWFRKELEFLKSIWQIPLTIPPELHHFYLVNTGKPNETTGEMVSLVRELYLANQPEMELVFRDNEKATKDVAKAIKENNQGLLMEAMLRGEKTLEAMGVVSESVKPLLRAIEKSGGAGKILGGGGKLGSVGFILIYHPDRTQAEVVVGQAGYALEEVVLGEEGIRLESGKI